MSEVASRSRAIDAGVRSALSVIALLLAMLPASAARGEGWQHWYVLELGGQPAGAMSERLEVGPEGSRLVTRTTMRVGRGSARITIEQDAIYLEDASGQLREMSGGQRTGAERVDSRWIFADDESRHETRQGERLQVRTHAPRDPSAIGPISAQRFVRDRLAAGAQRIEYREITLDGGLEPQVIRLRRLGEDRTMIGGRLHPVTLWEQTTSLMPGVRTTLTLSADGHVVRAETDLPFARMVTRLADEAEARRAMEGEAPQILTETFVRPDRAIESPRALRRAVYRLRAKEDALPALPALGIQRVAREPDGALLVTVDLDAPHSARADDPVVASDMAASVMIDSDDPAIRALVAEALREAPKEDAQRAEHLRRFVLRFITIKDLDTGFATASETARSRRGDCTEHAVLLAAMLRAAEIPARVAVGLMYAEAFAGAKDIFGWHMWTQAKIDGMWVDLDATLDVPMDAAHILTGVMRLDDGLMSAGFVSLLRLIGNVKIEVVEVGAP